MNQIGDMTLKWKGSKGYHNVTNHNHPSFLWDTHKQQCIIKYVYLWLNELLQPKIWQENLSFSFDSTAKIL